MPAAQYFHQLVNEIGNRNVLIDGELDFILPVVVESVADFRLSSPKEVNIYVNVVQEPNTLCPSKRPSLK